MLPAMIIEELAWDIILLHFFEQVDDFSIGHVHTQSEVVFHGGVEGGR